MPLDPQIGLRLYQFVIDRLEDAYREQYPQGRDTYLDCRQAAHDLDKKFAEAVAAGEDAEAERVLRQLADMASRWKAHLQYPAETCPA